MALWAACLDAAGLGGCGPWPPAIPASGLPNPTRADSRPAPTPPNGRNGPAWDMPLAADRPPGTPKKTQNSGNFCRKKAHGPLFWDVGNERVRYLAKGPRPVFSLASAREPVPVKRANPPCPIKYLIILRFLALSPACREWVPAFRFVAEMSQEDQKRRGLA